MLHIVLLSRALVQSSSKCAAGFSLRDAHLFQALVPVSQASLCDLRKVWDLSELVGWSFVWAGDQNRLCPGMSKDMMGIKSVRRPLHQLEAQDLWMLGSVTADYDRRLRGSPDGRGTQCGGQHPGKTGLWKGSPGDTGRRGEAGAPQTWTSLPAGRLCFCSGPCGPTPGSTIPGGLSLASQAVL